jgi:hypothetical protein
LAEGDITAVLTSGIVGGGNPGEAYTSEVYDVSSFVPTKFVLKDGSVLCRATFADGDYLVTYGGGYDKTVATIKSPYMSLAAPSTTKYAQGLGFAITGSWSLQVSLDQHSGTFEPVATLTGPTYDGGVVGLSAAGTHFAFLLQTTGATEAILSSVSLVFTPGDVR